MKAKSEAFQVFKPFKAYAENHFGHKIKALQDDKGGEYMSTEFQKFCDSEGIVRRHTVRNRPQQNGVAERANRTMSDDISAMLAESNLPPQFWGECLAAQVHVWNRLPISAVQGSTPYELWHGRKPDVSHLRVWGCTTYVHIQKDQRKQFGSHMQKCIFIGYPEGYKGWKFYNPETKKVIISERAEFDERYFPGLKGEKSSTQPGQPLPLDPLEPSDTVQVQDLGGDGGLPPNFDALPPEQAVLAPNPPPAQASAPMPLVEPLRDSPSREPGPNSALPQHAAPQHEPPEEIERPVTPPPQPVPVPAAPVCRSTRISRPPSQWWMVPSHRPAYLPPENEENEDELAGLMQVQFAGLAAGADPRTFKEAMNVPDAKHWLKAANEEIMSLMVNKTWEIVPLPPGKKAIGSGWVFKVKRNSDGTIERYKGRVVAKGYSQRSGFDYTEIFAPTFRTSALRLIFVLAAVEDLEMRSVDISSAFLNGDLDEEIYMRQPEGFHEGGPNMVCRLLKSLYGLKQSPRQWHKKLRSVLESMGFKRLKSDHSIYLYMKDDIRVILPVWVDDMTLVGPHGKQNVLEDFVKELAKHFKLRDLGPTTFLLGMEITRDRANRILALSQRQYILDMLERFGMSNCHPVKTPMDPGAHLTKDMGPVTSENKQEMSQCCWCSHVLGHLNQT